MADEDLEDLLAEIFMDDDSDEEDFVGFRPEDIRPRQQMNDHGDGNDSDSDSDVSISSVSSVESDGEVPDGYDHAWLQDFTEISGPKNVPGNISQVDLFQKFISDAVIDSFVTETNRYAEQVREQRGANAKPKSRISLWKPVSVAEMKAFIALLLLLGLTKRSSFGLYWSTDDYIEMPGFRRIMPRDRFLAILTFFHLVDNTLNVPRDDPQHDKAFKVRSFVNMIIPAWQNHYTPGKELSIDESMIPFKGRSNIIQYMPAKPTKWGLKAWGLAEASTGFMWHWKLYLGKENQNVRQEVGLAHRVVTELAEPLYDKGHVIYMDNFFSSKDLYQELADNQMGACGTLRINRRGIPDRLKQSKPKAGEPPLTVKEGNTMYMAWFDKRPVFLMSSAHSAETFRKVVRSKRHQGMHREVDKPCAIQSYSQHMGGD